MITLSVLFTSLLTWGIEQVAGPLLGLIGIKIGNRAKESAAQSVQEVDHAMAEKAVERIGDDELRRRLRDGNG
jgi:hypothetical protein